MKSIEEISNAVLISSNVVKEKIAFKSGVCWLEKPGGV